MNDRVIVALDKPNLEEAEKLISDLKGIISYYKVGLELFTACGWAAVDIVKKSGARVFLDLKLHDIPNTVSKTAKVICDHGVDMFNVHTSGGPEMMKKTRDVVDACSAASAKPVLIGVTVLTSLSGEDLKRIFSVHPSPGVSIKELEYVLHLAFLARESGLQGVVSSPQEVQILRRKLGKDFLLVTPGIRSAGDSMADQKRTLTAKEALEAGADYIVVGRPITQAQDPRKAAESLFV